MLVLLEPPKKGALKIRPRYLLGPLRDVADAPGKTVDPLGEGILGVESLGSVPGPCSWSLRDGKASS